MIFCRRTSVLVNFKWYRLSEKHMKWFVDIPRDLTALTTEILSRVAGHPFHPYSFFCDIHYKPPSSHYYFEPPTSSTLRVAAFLVWRFVCVRGFNVECVATELFKRHSVMVWTHSRTNHFVNLQFCKLCLKDLPWWNRFYFLSVVFGIIENVLPKLF